MTLKPQMWNTLIWLLNPFMQKYNQSPVTSDGNMYIQLGSFSEDIFKDGKQQFENGLPTTSQKKYRLNKRSMVRFQNFLR